MRNKKKLLLTKEQLREIQMVELEILLEVDRICRENNIKYSICYGTLLGAVRHKGFIPWDDDIDIAMLRPEYEKFCKVCETELDKERFFWQTWDTDPNYRIGYGKMRRLNTKYVRVGQEKMKYVNGIPIDIFPLDNIPDMRINRVNYLKKCYWMRKIMYSKAGSMCEKNLLKRLGYYILRILPEEKMKKKFTEYVLKFNEKETVNVYCAFANGNTGYYKEIFKEQVDIEFEGFKFKAPKDSVMFLRQAYGYDYMTPPPHKDRYGHAPVSAFKTIVPDFSLYKNEKSEK